VTYRVVLFCPDRHLIYDGRTPDIIGVGGGVTARVRMARALARQGHSVTQVVHCSRRQVIDGVDYRPLDDAGRLEADVAIFNTSGGALDLSPALGLGLSARLRIAWVHGIQKPEGLERLGADVVYIVSNFVTRRAVDEWGIPADCTFATYNGYEAAHFSAAESARRGRDPFQLVYFSHPSKGLDTAVAVLEQLRAVEPRFHLEVAGGERLWGGEELRHRYPPGVSYRGLMGQNVLMALLLQSTYSLQMQGREEPGGLAIHEAARAGCVILASPVGSYIEQIRDGVNGLVICGDHLTPDARRVAARRILDTHASPEVRTRISEDAKAWALDTDTLARAWTQDWQVRLDEVGLPQVACARCGGRAHRLEDGDHCPACGLFTRRVAVVGHP
jgi:glycosyltransferase involved in cell wall biosynthesis